MASAALFQILQARGRLTLKSCSKGDLDGEAPGCVPVPGVVSPLSLQFADEKIPLPGVGLPLELGHHEGWG